MVRNHWVQSESGQSVAVTLKLPFKQTLAREASRAAEEEEEIQFSTQEPPERSPFRELVYMQATRHTLW
ncbi:hypothetical protein AMECASPLE_006857 [Ameca splendens]|uniref:Uncharacterized protein n=1 Tax=Ameca splendens TaxID=208324 RepID=A0ABV0XCL0_9TELE